MPPLIDNALMDRFRDQPVVLRGLLELYLETSQLTIRNIDASLQSDNLEQIAFHAHSLKGSSLELGAKDLAAICQQLQVTAEDADKVSTVALVRRLLRCYKETSTALLELDID